jgi:hypothetical protein
MMEDAVKAGEVTPTADSEKTDENHSPTEFYVTLIGRFRDIDRAAILGAALAAVLTLTLQEGHGIGSRISLGRITTSHTILLTVPAALAITRWE